MSAFTETLSALVKRANQRIVQMEKSGKETSKAYQNLLRDSYNMKKDIFGSRQKGGIKFRTDYRNMSKSEMQSEYHRVKKFLEKEYSTVSSQKQHEKDVEENIKKGLDDIIGTYNNLTHDDIINIFSDARTKQIMARENMASDSILELANESKGNGKTIHTFLSRLNTMPIYELERWAYGKDDDTNDSDFIKNKRYK